MTRYDKEAGQEVLYFTPDETFYQKKWDKGVRFLEGTRCKACGEGLENRRPRVCPYCGEVVEDGTVARLTSVKLALIEADVLDEEKGRLSVIGRLRGALSR